MSPCRVTEVAPDFQHFPGASRTHVGAAVGPGQCSTNFIVSAQFEASGLAVHIGHFSDLGSRYKRKSESLKIARLWRPQHVLLRSSGHHLDTQISQTSLDSAKRILDRDRSLHKSRLVPPHESTVARCQKMCQIRF